MKSSLFVLVLIVGLSGCANKGSPVPVNPTGDFRGEIYRMNNILSLTVSQVARAQKEGYITVERESELLDKLDYAATAVDLAYKAGSGHHKADDQLKRARDLLAEVKNVMLTEAIEAARDSDEVVPAELTESPNHD